MGIAHIKPLDVRAYRLDQDLIVEAELHVLLVVRGELRAVIGEEDRGLGIAAHPMARSEQSVFLSAVTGEGIDALVSRLEALAAAGKRTCEFFFPSDKLGLIAALYAGANVCSVEYGNDGAHVLAVCDKKTAGQLSAYLVRS